MCGIAGYFCFGRTRVEPRCLGSFSEALKNRGPDDVGYAVGNWSLGTVREDCLRGGEPTRIGFAHRRLAILDLSQSGHQPLKSIDGRLWIVYNGELYNYLELRAELKSLGATFSSNSDTEVVLAAYAQWGRACVERFNGMFAFAIWDEAEQHVFCARDHLGIKPFHYCIRDGVFYFASTTPALLAGLGGNWELNPLGVYQFLHAEYPLGEHSVIKGIVRLPPANILTVGGNGHIEKRRYWDLGSPAGAGPKVATGDHFRELLDDAVRLQLRSDVKLGVFLSGGIDSSAITLIAHKISGACIDTFSVGYEGHNADERPVARRIAQQTGAKHHELVVTPHLVLEQLSRAVGAMSEPVADPAVLPTFLLSEMARSEGIKVVLSGTGGDEVFGGYSRYLPTSVLRRGFNFLSPSVKRTVSLFVPPNSNLGLRLGFPAVDHLGTIGGDLDFIRNFFLQGEDLRHYCQQTQNALEGACRTFADNRHYEQMYFDLRSYLVDDLLLLLDSMGMAVSVEGRVPLLDVRLVEFLFGLPANLHFAGGLKSYVRKHLCDILPDEVLRSSKMGFGGPVSHWMHSLGPHVREYLSASTLELENFLLNSDSLISSIKSEYATDRDLWRRFRIYVFEMWYREVKKNVEEVRARWMH